MARIAFFGTPDFSVPCLRTLASAHEVALVVCRPDAPTGRGNQPAPCAVKSVAMTLGLRAYESNLAEAEAEELIRVLTELRVDACVVVAFGPSIPENLLPVPVRGFVMVHASQLPRWRGQAPIERALEAGDTETGVSIVQMTRDRYAGNLYAVERIAISATDDAISLTAKLADLAASTLSRYLSSIVGGGTVAIPQASEGIIVAHPVTKAEQEIDWTMSAAAIVNKGRALAARGPLKLNLRDETISVFGARRVEVDHNASPGMLLHSTDELVFATACGAGVTFAEVQRAGDARIAASLVQPTLKFGGNYEPDHRRRSRLVSAALRHVRVAENLGHDGPDRSLDDAFYLAGFGPECAQAACLEQDWYARAIGHGFDVVQADNLRLLLSLDPRARRYLPADWGATYPVLSRWRVQSRYDRTGTVDATTATDMTRAARMIVNQVTAGLWADGLLDEGVFR